MYKSRSYDKNNASKNIQKNTIQLVGKTFTVTIKLNIYVVANNTILDIDENYKNSIHNEYFLNYTNEKDENDVTIVENKFTDLAVNTTQAYAITKTNKRLVRFGKNYYRFADDTNFYNTLKMKL